MTEPPRAPRRVLLHLEPGRRVPVEPDEVFLLEADGDETRVRTRGRRRLRDIRSLGEVLARFPPLEDGAGDLELFRRGQRRGEGAEREKQLRIDASRIGGSDRRRRSQRRPRLRPVPQAACALPGRVPWRWWRGPPAR